MPKIVRPSNLNEHIISSWLFEAGFKRGEVPKLLRIAPDRLHLVLKNPKTHLSCEQLETIAHATEKPINEVIKAVFFNGIEPQKNPQKWHEETTDQ